MDYLGGGSLLERRSSGPDGKLLPMTAEQILAWLADIARALDFVHGKGHVHRDVKPSNLLFDADANAYLTDFGIIKALGEGEQSHGPSLTGPGTFIGTPEYTAREVFAGADYDGRADQYSLAVVVYELLAGRRPFEGPTPFAIVQKQITTIPAGLHTLNAAVTAAVSEAVLKALSSLPEDRYTGCGPFVQAIDRARRAEAPKSPVKPRAAAPAESPAIPPSPPPAPAKPLPMRPSPPAPPAPKAAPKPLGVVTNSIGMKLVLIPAGEFLMGSPDSDTMAFDDEKPQHRVRITKPFYMGVYPVTQAEYERVMGKNPSHFQGDPNRPVESVSWDDAQEFCRKLSALSGEAGATYRLPTEAQWEYACRAGSTTRWCFGDDEKQLGDFAWFAKNSGNQTHPAGQKKPNAWGLYDMHGNVWEWCEDWFDSDCYKKSATDDPMGPLGGSIRVFRGGSWYYEARYCRSAYRGINEPGRRRRNLGFRASQVPADE
jgi:formylglycine-generating enzyme required for sulfatase activity